MKSLTLIAFCLLLSACANKNLYQRFYTAHDLSQLEAKYKPVIRSSDDPANNPRLILVGNIKEQVEIARSEGYEAIGHSSFYGPSIDDSYAISFGKTIGAELILLNKTDKDRIQEEVPTLVPIVSTTNTKYGSVNSTTLVGSSSKVGVDRINYDTGYFWKIKRQPVFGAALRDFTPDERKVFGSNKGMKVSVVIKGSPAYKADVLKDDVILRVGDATVDSQADYEAALKQYMGTEVTFVLNRAGKEIAGKARLNSPN